MNYYCHKFSRPNLSTEAKEHNRSLKQAKQVLKVFIGISVHGRPKLRCHHWSCMINRMPEKSKDQRRLALWKFKSLTTEVYIRSTEVQKGTTEVQKGIIEVQKARPKLKVQLKYKKLKQSNRGLSEIQVHWRLKVKFYKAWAFITVLSL